MMRKLLVILALLAAISSPAAASLGGQSELSIVLNPNITNIVTNNYTVYNISGGFAPVGPWLYNDTNNMYFNYSRLIFEFYNSSQTDALLNAQDECSEISGCVVGAITTSYNETYANTSADVTANRSSWLTNCYNSSYEGAYNATYHDTWQDVFTNRTAWFNTYNATYAATSADVTANRSSWLTNCYNASYEGAYNATYESTFNTTYDLTSKDVTANRSSWLTNCFNASYEGAYNATYESTYNTTYHNYWLLNYTNNSLYWNGLLTPPESWTDTYNATYAATSADVALNEVAWLTNCYNATYEAKWDACADAYACAWITQTDWDNNFHAEIPVCTAAQKLYSTDGSNLDCGDDMTVTDTYNETYANTSADVSANRTAWFNTYNATYAATSADVTANRTKWEAAYNYTINDTFINYLNSSIPQWANQTATAVASNVNINVTKPINTTSIVYASMVCISNAVSCDVFLNASGLYMNGTKKSITWNSTHMIIRNLGV